MEREVYPGEETAVIRAGGLELCLTRGGRRSWASDRFSVHADLTDEEFATVVEEAVSSKKGAFQSIVQRVFAKLPARDQEQFLAELREPMPELAAQLARDLVTFESLVKLDNRLLQKLVVEFTSEEWARALQESATPVVNAVQQNMSERARLMLKQDLQFHSRTDSAETNRIREKIITRLRQLRAGG